MNDRESIYELQKIDCNCNDCGFMMRNLERYRAAEAWHRANQLKEFERIKAFEIAEVLSNPQSPQWLIDKVTNKQFVFDKAGIIQHGFCNKKKKPVTFLPAICQLDTQDCFVHRKDFVNFTIIVEGFRIQSAGLKGLS